jgi:hypothetical protein
VIKSGGKRRQIMWHYVGEEKCTYGFGGGKLKERNHLVDPGIDVKIMLIIMDLT